jgi:peroxiredoxin
VSNEPPDIALQVGDTVPHFVVRGFDGSVVHYSNIWQHRNLVLVALPRSDDADQYRTDLTARASAFDEQQGTCVITREAIRGLPAPGLLVADRWGEIVHIVISPEITGLPSVDQLLQWLEAIEYRCPECEGESR